MKFALPIVMSLIASTLLFSACGEPKVQVVTPTRSEVVRITSPSAAVPVLRKIATQFEAEHQNVKVEIKAAAPGESAQADLERTGSDIVVINRPLRAEETGHPVAYHGFAKDAVVFGVHLSNPVQELTMENIQDIYGGKVTNWRDLGGPNEPILVLDRQEDDTARQHVLLSLMDGRPVSSKRVVVNNSAEMLQALRSTPNSIGYTSYGLFTDMGFEGIPVHIPRLDGISPDQRAVESGSYACNLPLGLVYRTGYSAAVGEFVSFVTGSEGRRLISASGYAFFAE